MRNKGSHRKSDEWNLARIQETERSEGLISIAASMESEQPQLFPSKRTTKSI